MSSKDIKKCCICSHSVNIAEEEFLKIGRRYAHTKCDEEQKNNPNSEYNQKIRMEIFICELFGKEFVPPFIQKQIKEYLSLGYTYKGIYYALFYFYKTKKNTVKKLSIGIVPYVYDEANRFYGEIEKRMKEEKENNKNTIQKEKGAFNILVQKDVKNPNTIPRKKRFSILED